MGRGFTLLSVVSSLLAAGCQSALPSCETPAPLLPTEYALVEYRLGEPGGEPRVETSDTETYRAEHSRYTTAALRPPDACVEPGASGAPALKSECNAWLGELERAFSAAGFRLLPWDGLLQLEREKSVSTFSAGRELGAEVVFVLNALEAAAVTAGASKLPKHEYFHSDERGGRGAPLSLDEQTRSAFLKYTLDAAAKSLQPDTVLTLTAVLDSTAIVTQTGESIWFYRRSAAVPTKAPRGLKLLFGRVSAGGWVPAAPVMDGAPAEGAAAPAANGSAEPAPGAQATTFEAERLELVRASAEHLVQAWKSGKVATNDAAESER